MTGIYAHVLTTAPSIDRISGRADKLGLPGVDMHAGPIYLSMDAETARFVAARLLDSANVAEAAAAEIAPKIPRSEETT